MAKVEDYFKTIIAKEYKEWPEFDCYDAKAYGNARGVCLHYRDGEIDVFFAEEYFTSLHKRLMAHIVSEGIFIDGTGIIFKDDKIYANSFDKDLYATFDLDFDNKCISIKWNNPSIRNDETIAIDEHMVDNIVDKLKEVLINSKCIQPYVSKQKYSELFDEIRICFVLRVLDLCTQWVNMLCTELRCFQDELCQLNNGVFDKESEYYQLQDFYDKCGDLENKIAYLEAIIESAQFGMYDKDNECKKIMTKA